MERFKSSVLLHMYSKVKNNESFTKEYIVDKFNVSERTVTRYIKDLNNYFQEEYIDNKIIYNRKSGLYELKYKDTKILNEKDILSICKVLLESKGFSKEEIEKVINKLLCDCVSEDKKIVENIIANELFNYVPTNHGKPLIDKLWDLSIAINNQDIIEIEYFKLSKNGKLESEATKRNIKPLSIMFSEYYFYLAAFIEGTEYKFPTIYRVDRIESFESTNRNFSIDYSNRFKDGEFRKLIQFMHTGNLQKIRFKFTGNSLEAVLDRLPNAKVLEENQGEYIIETEMFGTGIKMWLLSQGSFVEVLEPIEFREEIKSTIEKMKNNYI
ncbi:helix-turn-helix transcriptional regulator [Clostridium algidicarnis]|uniref:WYL domain-containing protein n=2 Tax=Clostridium algidicarnis TaxID=37659 RepID=A0ABS6C487_9CLOT|nr:WYL domain-containing protein [Clostridium algidicarnis]MBB6630747.1 WYL domain-containing protein [Clostridium algidicarnis]MBU3220301.1 WYL domain-containing protein [Clostridium algidicarnis]MBU3228721.1 WYL domain-containing protein [Clostridium algidicarnis]MBU3252265.1 WYL domain-containing protein [Clostridium algidicarnis]MCB2286785.1 WYL domain-containing protein [Clostridium algidicarnis]